MACPIFFWERIDAQYEFAEKYAERENIEQIKVRPKIGTNTVNRLKHDRQHGQHNPKNKKQLNKLIERATILTWEQQSMHLLAHRATPIGQAEFMQAVQKGRRDFQNP